MDLPLISAVMVTGKDPARRPLALAAIQSFTLQTYPNKELVIVNTGQELVLKYENVEITGGLIREVTADPTLTLGELRNIGLSHSKGSWIMQWDDDDWSHPYRMALQMNAAARGCAVLLRWQLRYSFPSDAAFDFRWTYTSCPGIPGTILHPHGLQTYRSEPKKEDEYFVEDHFKNKVVVVNNSPERDLSHMYLRFYHGHNTWDEKHVMQTMPNWPNCAGDWKVSHSGASYLRSILNRNYAECLTSPKYHVD